MMLFIIILISFQLFTNSHCRTPPPGIKVNTYNIISEVQARFAITDVVSEMQNTGTSPQEVKFTLILPDSAFISHYSMTIDGRTIEGQVKERDAAKDEYDEAKRNQQTAGLVSQTTRDVNTFEIATNLAAGSTVTFNTSYQEMLKRVQGVYKHVITINPDYDVAKISVDVLLAERSRITKIHVPKLAKNIGQLTNKELLAKQADPAVQVKTMSQNTGSLAYIYYEESASATWGNAPNGQMVILYDVDRDADGGEIETLNGYFVHFIAPDGIPKGDKDVIFVIDRSGSMLGAKLAQVKSAMNSILSQLDATDYFNIITFSDNITTWLNSPVPASADNVRQAKEFVNQIIANGGTNINDPLLRALRDLKSTQATRNPLISMVILLTDGAPTVGVTDKEQIVRNQRSEDTDKKMVVHCIAFGADSDFQLMRDIAESHNGIARKIYADSDAEIQLQGFYDEISVPLIANLNVKYLNESANVNTLVRSDALTQTLNDGGETVIAGKLNDNQRANRQMQAVVSGKTKDGEKTLTATNWPNGRPVAPCYERPTPLRIRGQTFDQFANMPPPQHIQLCPSLSDEPMPGVVDTHVVGETNTIGGFIERMWAYMTIQKLVKEAQSGLFSESEKQDKQNQALQLSLKYAFVTPVTSMIVVDNQGSSASSNLERDSPINGPPRRAKQTLQEDLAVTPTPSNTVHLKCNNERVAIFIDTEVGGATAGEVQQRKSNGAQLIRDIITRIQSVDHGPLVRYELVVLGADRTKMNLYRSFTEQQDTRSIFQDIDDIYSGKVNAQRNTYVHVYLDLNANKNATSRAILLTDGSKSLGGMASRLTSLQKSFKMPTAAVAIHAKEFDAVAVKELTDITGSRQMVIEGTVSAPQMDSHVSC